VDFLILPIEGSLAGSRELQSCRLDAGDQSLFVGNGYSRRSSNRPTDSEVSGAHLP
jgi:hypothetical protein